MPFQQLLCDLQPALSDISPRYVADPRPVGGSLYRIQRDTRRYRDKAPYKSWQDAELFYGRRHAEAPSFFLHVEAGQCYLAAGLWWPEPAGLIERFYNSPESQEAVREDTVFVGRAMPIVTTHTFLRTAPEATAVDAGTAS